MRGLLLVISIASAVAAFVFYLDARASAQGLQQRLARIQQAQPARAASTSPAMLSPGKAPPVRVPEQKADPIVFRPTQEDLDSEDKFHRERSESIPVIRARQRQVQRKYYYLFDALSDLDPQARAVLKEILANRELTLREAGNAAYRTGATNPDEIRAATKALEAEAGYDRKLKEALGDRYERFRELEGHAGAFHVLDNVFALDFKRVGAPLDGATKMKMAEIMTRLHYSRRADGYREMLAEPVNPTSGLTPLNERLFAEARVILTPAQLDVIKMVQKNQTNGRLAGGNP